MKENYYVSTGDLIHSDSSSVPGLGTHVTPTGCIAASISGDVSNTGALIRVTHNRSIYSPVTGGVVIGRVIQELHGSSTSDSKLKLNIRSSIPASLLSSNINLPSGEQRKRNEQDMVELRKICPSNTLICAEIQKVTPDEVSLKVKEGDMFGILGEGILLEAIISKANRRFLTIEYNGSKINAIASDNRYVFLSAESLDKEGYKILVYIRNCIVAMNNVGIYFNKKNMEKVLKIMEEFKKENNMYDITTEEGATCLNSKIKK